jgi:uncharacterized delta-60 repeat protein
VAVAPDGSIVVVGSSIQTDDSFAVARFRPGGRFDDTFSGDGRRVIDVAAGVDQAYDVGILSTGRIVAAGFASDGTDDDYMALRLRRGGSLDATFGGTGIVMTDLGFGGDDAFAMVVQANDKVVLGGYAAHATDDFGLVRYLP